ncbi:hypothetical protein RFI_05365 [Reticulomyxa filosa]|uniref:Uncharacterized protein n=1 Tax=Reticulomyxa filosa TaxID=46433 RepID=X6P0U5_RETFI|nr:hypothetical protein RFI_05365 [Reticulomyxa filosa]|eukprot:ETO31753.1 hypothetical protein RFI_05365 [Reticulomyxa filosa]
MQENIITADFELDEDNINAETMKVLYNGNLPNVASKDSAATNNEENKKEETMNSDNKKDSPPIGNDKSSNPNDNKTDNKDDNKIADKTEEKPKRRALSMNERIALRKERFTLKKERKVFEKKKSASEELKIKIASRKRRFSDLNKQTLHNPTEKASQSSHTSNACGPSDETEIKRRKKLQYVLFYFYFYFNNEMAEKIRTRLARFASGSSTDNPSNDVSETNTQANIHDPSCNKIQQRLARFAASNSIMDPLSSSNAQQFEEIKKKRQEKFANGTKITSTTETENGHNKQSSQKQLIQQRLQKFGLDTSTTNTQLLHNRAQTQLQLLEQRKKKFQPDNGHSAPSAGSNSSILKDKLKLRKQRFQNISK